MTSKPTIALAAVTLTVVLAGGGYLASRLLGSGASSAALSGVSDRPRIAVLPFVNAGRDTSDRYFAEGISDQLIEDLGEVPALTVVSRRSSFAFKDSAARSSDIGAALGVSSLLEGTVQRDRQRLRIAARLTRVSDGFVLWSDRWDRAPKDILAVQDAITRAVVAALRPMLEVRPTPVEVASPSRALAYDTYLLAKYEAARLTQPDLRAALETYRLSLSIDSTYAPAWVGIARTWYALAGESVAPREAYPAASDALRRALELDSLLADAFSERASFRLFYEYDLAQTVRDAERARALKPSDAVALRVEGLAMSVDGRTDSAIALLRRARALDPLSSNLGAELARVLLHAGRYDEAIATARSAAKVEPRYALAHLIAGQALLAKGRPADALREFEQAGESRARSLSGIANAQAQLGRLDEARSILAVMLAESTRRYVRPELIAWTYLAVGDRENALTWLEKGYEARSSGMIYLGVDPRWIPLREEARFRALLRSIRPT